MTFIVRLYIAGVSDALRLAGASGMADKANAIQKGMRK